MYFVYCDYSLCGCAVLANLTGVHNIEELLTTATKVMYYTYITTFIKI